MNRLTISLLVAKVTGRICRFMIFISVFCINPFIPKVIMAEEITPQHQVTSTTSEVQRSQNVEIKIEDNSVYLKAERANLKELLLELGKCGGFEVSADSLSSTITISIKEPSLEKTIHRIMNIVQERNYNIYYNKDGSIKRLEVLSLPEDLSTTPQPKPPRPPILKSRRPPVPPPPLIEQKSPGIHPPARRNPQDDEDEN